MEPIVDGLENNFSGEAEFRRVDANSVEGQNILSTYQLLGHPSYLLLDMDGSILWKGLGVMSGEEIARSLREALAN